MGIDVQSRGIGTGQFWLWVIGRFHHVGGRQVELFLNGCFCRVTVDLGGVQVELGVNGRRTGIEVDAGVHGFGLDLGFLGNRWGAVVVRQLSGLIVDLSDHWSVVVQQPGLAGDSLVVGRLV